MKKTVLAVMLSLALGAAAQTATYTESILYAFGSTSISDGGTPNALVMDSAGNLYGTTQTGGGSTFCFAGCGMVFKISPTGTETILHIFTNNPDGAVPLSGLAIDKSDNLYGTTNAGGFNGNGTVFKITSKGKYSVLHKFGKTKSDGLYPFGPVVLDSAGNIYGTTEQGGSTSNLCVGNGSTGCGTIFKITAKGVETVLYKFTGEADGAYPVTNLVRDSKGNLYGSNISNVLFKVSPTGVATTLYTFPGVDELLDGSYTARNSSGTFYGDFDYPNGSSDGLWQVTSGGVETTYTLCTNCSSTSADGAGFNGPLLLSGGIVYGTASAGGASGGGAVYEFDSTTSTETILYNFPNPGSSTSDGWTPNAGVIMDSAGNLYGTTIAGEYFGNGQMGTVFKLTKN